MLLNRRSDAVWPVDHFLIPNENRLIPNGNNLNLDKVPESIKSIETEKQVECP